MGWSNVVVEGYCLNKTGEFNNCLCNDIHPGTVSYLCLWDESKKNKCEYFLFCKARSGLVLTDENGYEVAYQGFDCDSEDSEKYKKEEKNWINKWVDIIEAKI